MRRMLKVLSSMAVVAMLSASMSAHAQYGLYAMGSGGFLSAVNAKSGPTTLTSQSFSAFGGTFGLYDDAKKLGPLRFGGDLRGFIENSSNSNPYGNQLRGFLVGGRAEVNTHVIPFRPYFQVGIGDASTNYGSQSTRSNSFAYQFQFGADLTLFPRIDARFEYGDGEIGSIYNGFHQTMQQAGAGIVVRLSGGGSSSGRHYKK
jgi:hypothetical protein